MKKKSIIVQMCVAIESAFAFGYIVRHVKASTGEPESHRAQMFRADSCLNDLYTFIHTMAFHTVA